ncbi:MAG: 5'-3'-deoxyribonucleotidase [Bacteroidota bacterium]
MIILLDMDGVLADFEMGLLQTFKSKHPEKPCIELQDRTQFYAHLQYPPDSRQLIQDIVYAPGFFRNLPPIPGAMEACRALAQSRHELFICTSPLSKYEHCVLEKYQWVEEHLGMAWTRRMILTKDKTLVHGDFLIDDKFPIKGVRTPTWEHLLYSQPYNRSVQGKRRINWQNWRSMIPD